MRSDIQKQGRADPGQRPGGRRRPRPRPECLWTAVALFVLSPTWAAAQELVATGSVTVARSTQSLDNTGSRVGIGADVGLDLWILPGLAIRSGASYARKGLSTDGGGFYVHMDYVEVPLAIRLAPWSSPGSDGPLLGVGVSLAHELRCGGVGDMVNPPGLPPGTYVGPIDCDTIRTSRQDLGLLLSAAYAPLGDDALPLTLEARYVHGLVDLEPSRPFGARRNRALTLLLGLQVGLAGQR